MTPAPVIVRCIDAAEVNSLTIISNDGGNIVNNIAELSPHEPCSERTYFA